MRKLIVIPAYNEAPNITHFLRELKGSCEGYDIVVINDGSKDETSAICRKEGIEVLDLPCNLGIGGAVQTGYRYGLQNGYDVVIQMDGDGQHDPCYLDELVAPILLGEFDMVIGSRFMNEEGFQSSSLRRFGIRFYTHLIHRLTGKQFTDPTSGFRAAGKEIISYFATYYPIDYPEPESIVSLIQLKYRIQELPVNMRSRQGGKSSIHGIRSFYYMSKVTLAIFIAMLKKEKRIQGKVPNQVTPL